MPEVQNYKNHVRFDPLWHFFIAPLFLLNFIFSIYVTVRHWPEHRVLFCWYVVMSFVSFWEVGNARQQTLTVQDRVIRLEERLRFAALLPPDLQARAHSLTVNQIVALRFASDDELPSLIQRALDHNMSPKQIKESIKNWRPDYLRA